LIFVFYIIDAFKKNVSIYYLYNNPIIDNSQFITQLHYIRLIIGTNNNSL